MFRSWSLRVWAPGVSDTEARIKRLGAITGWKLEKPEYEDKRLDRDSVNSKDPQVRKGSQEVGPAPVMSSVSFQTTANLVDYAQGTLALEPFLRAFRDLNKVNVTYLIPGQFTYRGLRQFTDTKVEIGARGCLYLPGTAQGPQVRGTELADKRSRAAGKLPGCGEYYRAGSQAPVGNRPGSVARAWDCRHCLRPRSALSPQIIIRRGHPKRRCMTFAT
jgi:hypothetical protein